MATFFPGPIFARTRGLHTVKPAHIIGPASVDVMLSGMGNVKYSCALMWLEYPPCEIVPSSYGAPYVSEIASQQANPEPAVSRTDNIPTM